MFFYFLFGSTLILYNVRRSASVTIFLIVTLIIVGFCIKGGASYQNFYTNSIMMEFVFGLLIALYVTSYGGVPWYCAIAIALAGIVSLCMVNSASWSESYRFLFWGAPAALLVFGTVSLEMGSWRPWQSRFEMLGDASYSIYLSHIFSQGLVLLVWTRYFRWLSPWSFALMAIGFAIFTGILCYHILERPLLRISRVQFLGAGARRWVS